MRFTSKGIGWLIAGGLICSTAVGDDSITSAVGTALFGLVFIVVYIMKQYFDPKGVGFFIAGGILLAFGVETFLGMTGGLIKNSFLDRDDLSSVLFAIVIAGACLFAFYRRNQSEVDDMAADIGADMNAYRPEPAQETVETIETVETVETVETAAPAEQEAPVTEQTDPDIEFEIETKDEDKE